MDVNQIGNINDGFTKRDNCNQGRVYDTNALSPAINTMQGGGLQPHIAECVVLGGIGDKNSNNGTQFYQQDRVYEMGDVAMCHPANIPGGSYRYLETKCLTEGDDRICLSRAEQSRAEQSRAEQSSLIRIRQATKEGSAELMVPGIADMCYPDSKTRRARVQEKGQISPALCTEGIPSVIEEWTWEIDGELYLIRIRKLTPKECWRLLGFWDDDYEKAAEVNSATQLYKQAGNSIVVDVLEQIFKGMM